jgi:hypothetical protein
MNICSEIVRLFENQYRYIILSEYSFECLRNSVLIKNSQLTPEIRSRITFVKGLNHIEVRIGGYYIPNQYSIIFRYSNTIDLVSDYLLFFIAMLIHVMDPQLPITCRISSKNIRQVKKLTQGYDFHIFNLESVQLFNSALTKAWKQATGQDLVEAKERIRTELKTLIDLISIEEWTALYNEVIIQEIHNS